MFVVSLMAYSPISTVKQVFLSHICPFGLRAGYRLLKKILSSNPEFELTNDEFVIYDNRYYDKVAFADMNDCKLYYGLKSSVLIAISLKSESTIENAETNAAQRMLFGIPEGIKVVFL